MALLNPAFHEPGVHAGTALNWTLRSFCQAQKIFGFGPSPVRAVEDFERWFGLETEMDLTTSVRTFFDGMVFGVESFEGWGAFTSELETSCVSASFAGQLVENMQGGWLGYPFADLWSSVSPEAGKPEQFNQGWRSNESFAWQWDDVLSSTGMFSGQSVESFALAWS